MTMEKILILLLEITLYSTILLLGILAFQKVFEKHISAKLKYGVWFLLLLRFLIPVTFESNIQLVPIAPNMSSISNYSEDYSKPDKKEQDNNEIIDATKVAPVETTNETTNKVEPKNAWQRLVYAHWPDMLLTIWLMGTGIMLGKLCIRYYKFNRYIKRNAKSPSEEIKQQLYHQKTKLQIQKNIGLKMLAELSSPALIASLKPTVLLPETIEANALEFGILHELTHYKRKDHLMVLLLHILSCIHWFNPAVWIAKKCILADMELVCDAQVAAYLTKKERRTYAQTLIGLPVDGNYKKLAVGMRGATKKNTIEKRIKSIMMNRKTKHFAYVSLLLLVMLMGMLCFTTACTSTAAQGAEPSESVASVESEANNQEENDEQGSVILPVYEDDFTKAGKQKPQAMETALTYVAQKLPEKEVVAYYTDAIQVLYDDNNQKTNSMLIDCYIIFSDETAIYIGVDTPQFTIHTMGELISTKDTDAFLSKEDLAEYLSNPDAAKWFSPYMDKR